MPSDTEAPPSPDDRRKRSLSPDERRKSGDLSRRQSSSRNRDDSQPRRRRRSRSNSCKRRSIDSDRRRRRDDSNESRRSRSRGRDDKKRSRDGSRKSTSPEKRKEVEEPGASKRKRRSGWDSTGGIQSTAPPSSIGFAASFGGKTAEQIQLELAERQAHAAIMATSMQSKASMHQLCRIYVGSLDYALTDADIRQVFSAFGAIVNIDMPKEGNRSKGFCFVEYTSPDSAEMALQTMPGFNLKGRSIKVGRPTALGGTQMMTVATQPMPASLRPGGSHSAEGQFAVMMPKPEIDSSQNRIYVGSVPYTFTADDMKQIFEVFGQILSCQLIPSLDKPGTHRGYGFIEYATLDQAKLAIETMNNFEVAGKQLKVNHATALKPGGLTPGYGDSQDSPVAPLTPMSMGAGVMSMGAGAMSMGSGAMSMGSGVMSMGSGAGTGANAFPMAPSYVPDMAAAGMAALSGLNKSFSTPPMPPPTPPPFPAAPMPIQAGPVVSNILVMCNMVSPEEANEDLKEEIRQECNQYGNITQVQVHSNQEQVRIFVVFDSASSCSLAVSGLDDRWFGGRKISAMAYNVQAFESMNFWL